MATNATARLRRSTFVLTCASALVATPFAAATAASTPYLASPVTTSVGDGVTHEDNPRVPEGASWTEHYFPSSDGSDVELHADVLRPAHLPADAQTPVILSVGP